MDIITGFRGSGKTTQLVKRAVETQSTIVCPHRLSCENIQRIAKENELVIPEPMTWKEFLASKGARRGAKSYMFDELETMLIDTAKGRPIEAVTFSIEKLK